SAGSTLTTDPAVFSSTATLPARITLGAQRVLTDEVDAAIFPVSYKHCVSGVPQDDDGDNLPDLYPQIRLVKLSADDPSGMRPEVDTQGNLTVIPASVDVSVFGHSLSCGGAPLIAASLPVVVAPAAFK